MSETNTVAETTPAAPPPVEQAQTAAPQEQKTKAAALKQKATGDLLHDIAAEVEQMGKQKAQNRAVKLSEDIDRNSFELGGVLRVILKNGWFEGHESFGVYCMNTFGFQERKARYLIEIYEKLVEAGIPWEKVKDLGWTKLKDIARFLTKDNVDEWVEKASKLTVIELQKMLKEGTTEAAGDAKTTSDSVTFKVKLHTDQLEIVQSALAKAKAETNTEHDNVALERIAAGYLGGTVTAAKVPDLKELMNGAGWEAVLNAFGECFPQVNLEVTVPE